jgi:hypothetical protein
MKLLPQSTAITPKVGPFLSSTDGVTAQTALTIVQADCTLFKNNGAGAQKNSSTSATHDTGGVYGVPFNTTDTATLGPLKLLINKSGALPVWEDWIVVPVNIYNSWVLNTADMNVNIDAISGLTAPVAAWAAAVGTLVTGTVDNTAFTATTSVLETSSITTAATDHWVGRVILFTSGTLQNQATRITAYSLSGGRGHFTYNTVTSAPASGVSFVII